MKNTAPLPMRPSPRARNTNLPSPVVLYPAYSKAPLEEITSDDLAFQVVGGSRQAQAPRRRR